MFCNRTRENINEKVESTFSEKISLDYSQQTMTEMNNEITINIMTYIKIDINRNHNDLVLFVGVATGGVQERLVLEQVDWVV